MMVCEKMVTGKQDILGASDIIIVIVVKNNSRHEIKQVKECFLFDRKTNCGTKCINVITRELDDAIKKRMRASSLAN